jgi:hypothetical protein
MPPLINAGMRVPRTINAANLPLWGRFHVQRQVNVGTERAGKMCDARIDGDHATQCPDHRSRFSPVWFCWQHVEHQRTGELRTVLPDLAITHMDT